MDSSHFPAVALISIARVLDGHVQPFKVYAPTLTRILFITNPGITDERDVATLTALFRLSRGIIRNLTGGPDSLTS